MLLERRRLEHPPARGVRRPHRLGPLELRCTWLAARWALALTTRITSHTSDTSSMKHTSRLYHGGVAGLALRETLLPPSVTGTPACTDHDRLHCSCDRVHLTTDPTEAATYAAL